MKEYFSNNGSIQLEDFLQNEQYLKLLEALRDQPWKVIGPVNRRHYNTLGRFENESLATGYVSDFSKILRSKSFTSYLEDVTGLSLRETFLEVRKFGSGCYTLVHDNVDQHEEAGLDVVLHLGEQPWDEEDGGHHIYMNSTEELLSFNPVPNSLSLVYRDEGGVMRFVKYINHLAVGDHYEFTAVFWEEPEQGEQDVTEEKN
eukprot:TRINITY_DN5219_c0_g1_i2.p1 TRINITY_DN5219_c0_g1~~TRINITY_DN5219_c0_g1_i2.p1  ORF type:complete len:202 (+),score=42.71 TRINITY_DN5219_c0_g1_i2:822-1427(+)